MLWLAQHLPIIGAYMVPVIAVLGTILLMISSNSGVYGSSRIVYSMAHNDLLPRIFTYVHPKFKTPIVALFVFAGIAVLEFIAAGLTSNALETLAQMYAFSAAVNYLLVFIALLRLRFTDTETPRTFRMPWNVAIRRPSRTYDVPISGLVGVLFLVAVLIMVVITNAIGRVAGPAWVVAGFAVYAIYRRYRRLPILQSVPRDYSRMQMEVYEESGETGLADEYRDALRRAERKRLGRPPEPRTPPRT
jgi:APA family basic amino acid/polyamine antiporter